MRFIPVSRDPEPLNSKREPALSLATGCRGWRLNRRFSSPKPENRTRTVPAVAAVAATVAGVVALGIANASDAKENRETYTPTLRAGDGVVAAYGAQADDWEPIRRALEREIPAATVEPVEGLPEGGSDGSVSLRFRTAEHRNFLYSYGGSLGASVLVADRLPGLPSLDPDQGAVVDRVLTTGRYVIPLWYAPVSRIAHVKELHYPAHTPLYGDWPGFLPEVWWWE